MIGLRGDLRSVLMWKIVLYNVLSLVSTGRTLEIAITCKADIVICTGTRLRSPSGRRHWKEELENGYWAVHFGWQRQPFTNKAAGVSFIFGPRVSADNVVKVEAAPVEIAGRGGYVRVKSKVADMVFMAAYPPPFSGDSDGKARVQTKAIDKTISWMREKLLAVPVRSLPVVGADNVPILCDFESEQ